MKKLFSLTLLSAFNLFGFEVTDPKLTVIGTGYVGLVSGACFSELGHSVICVDNDHKKVQTLLEGKMPFYEPGLEEIVKARTKDHLLDFTTKTQEAVSHSNIAMICVGTPQDEVTGEANLSYIYQSASDVAKGISDYTVVVVKSTVPVGTCDKVASIIEKERPDLKRHIHFDVASNPEFLREGSAISDFMKPDRIAVGVDDTKSKMMLQKLYKKFSDQGYPVFFTTIQSSEISKYASNAMLALKISFINQISDLCEKTETGRIEDVATIMGSDKRIGPMFLNPGPGYGGSCFPKDTSALAYTGRTKNASLSLVEEVNHYNEQRKKNMVNRILKISEGAKNFAVWGITFKGNTDDLRDSPALTIIPELLEKGMKLSVYDPMYNGLTDLPKPKWDVTWSETLEDSLNNQDGLIILTEWDQFKKADLNALKQRLKNPVVIDLRNLYDERKLEGIHYVGLGKQPKKIGE